MLDVSFHDFTGGNLIAIKYRLDNPIKTNDILTLLVNFNCGLLSGDIYKTQANFERRLHNSFFENTSERELESLCKKRLNSIHSNLSKLDKSLKRGEDIRLWLDNSAPDRCALYWFCDYAKKYDSKIYTVICPGIEIIDTKNKPIEKTKWGAFKNLYYMASFANSAKQLSKGEINLYSELWQKLVKENAPLRVLIDDKIVSTTDDFFDKVILSFISYEPKPQAAIIGNFLTDWYCADFGFVSERIEFLLKQNIIEIVEDKINNEGSFVNRTLKLKN